MQHWEFGALGVHNPRLSTYSPFFNLVRSTEMVTGDVLELGVARGASLLTTGLILEEVGSSRKVLGIDTFSGFPETSPEDEFDQFYALFESGLITREHLESAELNRELVLNRGGGSLPTTLSTSGDFSETSMSFILEKIQGLGLGSRIKVQKADLSQGLPVSGPFSLVLLDLDLYLGYANTLDDLYDRLSPGGSIYLDEYYSLKFPGPRLAVSRFQLRNPSAELVRLSDWWDFERWIISKGR